MVRRALRLAAVPAVVVAALAVGGIALAVWYDRVPVAADDLRSATVTLTADGQSDVVLGPFAVQPQVGTSSMSNVPVELANGGNVPIDYRLEDVVADGAGTPGLVDTLDLRVAVVAPGACTGTEPGTAIPLTTGSAVEGAAFVDLRSLEVGAAEQLCISLTVPDVLSGEVVVGSTSLVFSFTGQNR